MVYPIHFAREDCFASYYAEIAVDSYYKIKNIFEKYENQQDNLDIIEETSSICKNQMICCVFSEMALESYFNDYAAACLGDSEFYSEYDKLSVLGKLQLIVQFVFNKDFDKSKEYYAKLKELVRDRNNLVHNKSKRYDFEKFAVHDKPCEECGKQDFDEKKVFKNELNEIKKSLKESKQYIKAIVCIAKLFYDNDSQSHPFFRLFCGVLSPLKKQTADVFAKEFGIEWTSITE